MLVIGKRRKGSKMPCESKIVVLNYFRGEKSSEQWELEVQYLLKSKVGVNLLYPKIGEIDPYAIEQMDQSSKGTNICYSIPD